jgi:hypothetical protein
MTMLPPSQFLAFLERAECRRLLCEAFERRQVRLFLESNNNETESIGVDWLAQGTNLRRRDLQAPREKTANLLDGGDLFDQLDYYREHQE